MSAMAPPSSADKSTSAKGTIETNQLAEYQSYLGAIDFQALANAEKRDEICHVNKYIFTMKTQFSPVLFLALAFLLSSCAESIERDSVSGKVSSLENREILTKAIADRLSQGVTRSDVEDYLVYRMNVSLATVKDIIRYDIDEDAYIFIVNLNDGRWFIFSGDYSSVPVIAEGEEELYISDNFSSHLSIWFQTIRDKIVENRNVRSENVSNNQKSWFRAKYLSAIHSASNRSLNIDTNDSYLVLDTLNYLFYPQMTVTSWNQYPPSNNALPKIPLSSDRCKAGCVVIAIAQLLYYTHYHFGFPNDYYSHASCNQYYYEGPNYNFNLSIPSASSWNYLELAPLPSNTDPYLPALVAQIADRSRTTYGLDYPSATQIKYSYGETKLDSIPGTLASFYLANVHNRLFSIDSVVFELANSRPVLCSGLATDTSTYGHTFLIDGYKWTKIKETEYEFDENGQILGTTVTIYDEKEWSINTGDHFSGHHIWVHEGYYYPYDRQISIGWRQNYL